MRHTPPPLALGAGSRAPRARALGTAAFELFAALLAPPRCAACDARAALLTVFCPACASTTERADARPALGSTHGTAALVWGGAVARAIARMKYEHRPDLARPLGDLLARALDASRGASLAGGPRPRDLVVVPVPLHATRLAERGFNQAALLAARVARRVGAPLRPLALERARPTGRQASLDRTAREANVDGAFRARAPAVLRGRHVLLVDDVRTTGATLDACARVVLDAGAASAGWAVVARAPHRVDAGGAGEERFLNGGGMIAADP